MPVGTLDASQYIHGAADNRKRFASDLVGCLHKDGYAKLRNHGISAESVNEIFSWVRSPVLSSRRGCD